MEDLALHILDIVENSIAASAKRIELLVVEDKESDVLLIEIKDDGKGMDKETREKALDPFFTTRTTRRVGLGIPLLAQAARESDGRIEIESQPGEGTTITAFFRHSHPDRKPLGDLLETIRTIVAGRPETDFKYEHRLDDSIYRIDTRDMKAGDAQGPA
jgi:anti-sigma regulatory factor (Ser/Thr protein kinase)